MNFEYIGEGIDAVVIDNFYTKEQLVEIMSELNWLTKPSIMLDASKLKTAQQNGEVLADKSGVCLEHVFVNWRHSALISHEMTQMGSPVFRDALLGYNTMFKSLFACNTRKHLLSYYENAQYYKPHKDAFFFTVLNYFYNEPKQFTGGDLVLYSNKAKKTIEPKHNRAVVLLSATPHEVQEIVSTHNSLLTGSGRYCNAVFLSTVYKGPND